jgi:Phage integrase family/Helix-turn-helix domain
MRRENLQSRYVFNTERGGPVTRAWFLKMVRRTGELAKLPFPAHPHMLRHACGFKLANDGVDTRALQHFLGHRNIMHTVRYTELRSDRFDGFWKDWPTEDLTRGVRFGRPRKLTAHQRDEALQRLASGETQADVARTYNVDPATISRLAPASPFRPVKR